MNFFTTEEYQAIADSLDLPNGAFIDGGYRLKTNWIDLTGALDNAVG